jgi:7-cyano-7-deazaguanine synthase
MGFKIKGLFIDYGQLARSPENNAATAIAKYYDIKLDQITVDSKTYFGAGEIKGRNALFIILALTANPQFQGIISMGIHSGSPYYDCSGSFIKSIGKILDGYSEGEIRIDAPFLTWDKQLIYRYCLENKVPINLTYSCQAGTVPPCGDCDSCKDIRVLNDSEKI